MSSVISLLVILLVLFMVLRPRAQRILSGRVISPLTPGYMVAADLRQIAAIPTSAGSVSITSQSANVNVVRQGEGDQISVRAKFRGNWSIEGNSIIQTRESGRHVLETDAGNFRLVGLFGTMRESLAAERLSVTPEGVFIDGKSVNLLFDSDDLEVVVPNGFRGGLTVHALGSGDATIGDWLGGAVDLESASSANFNVGKMSSVKFFNLALNGSGDAECGDILSSGPIDVKSLRSGNFTAGDLRTLDSTFTLSMQGTGDFNFANVEANGAVISAPVGSNCNISGTKIDARTLKFEVEGTGDVELDEIGGGRAELSVGRSNSNFTVNRFSGQTVVYTNRGTGDLTADQVNASDSCTINLEEGSNCNVNIGTMGSGSTRITSMGTGDLELGTVRGEAASFILGSNSNLSLDELSVSGHCECFLRGSGDANIGTLKAGDALCESTHNGDLTIGYLDTNRATLASLSSRTITVEDGRSTELTLKAEGNAEVNVAGSYDNITTQKSGNGSISID